MVTTKQLCQPDFPAAHSMDTTWFAVDRDVHVGVFDSNEPGAVPEVVTQQDDEISEDLAARPETGEPALDLSGIYHPGLLSRSRLPRLFHPKDWPEQGWTQFLLFCDDSELIPDIRTIPGVRVETVDGMVVVWMRPEAGHPGREAWKAFIEQAAEGRTGVFSDICFLDIDLARRGLFAYRAHDDRFYIPEPYGRLFTPFRPLLVGDAPPPLRDELAKRVHLDVSFASSPYIQPAELVPCQTWGNEAAYLASDGFTLRPLPGAKHADYLELAAHIREGRIPAMRNEDIFKPLVFDPPLGR